VLPNFVIVGAPKCGTSSLAAWLRDHPDVYVVPEKELFYFTSEWERGQRWYEQCFAANGQKAVGEATPTYLHEHRAHARLADVIPDAKLIAMVRNPVDRAYSHYWHWHERKGDERTFEEAIAPELAGERDDVFLAPGRYAEHLRALGDHFAPEQIQTVVFDDLAADPGAVYRAACSFLGVDDATVPDSVGSVENSFRYYYPRWLWAVFVRVRIGRFLPGRAGAALYRAMVRTADPYPPMADATRARLVAYFEQPTAELAQMLGRDLSHWR
jgi:hypothetical protein